jgi:hypothetical protein
MRRTGRCTGGVQGGVHEVYMRRTGRCTGGVQGGAQMLRKLRGACHMSRKVEVRDLGFGV